MKTLKLFLLGSAFDLVMNTALGIMSAPLGVRMLVGAGLGFALFTMLAPRQMPTDESQP